MLDEIIREITLKAPQERVYHVMTDPSEITKWFPDAVLDGNLEVGSEPYFEFREYGVKSRILVVASDPFSYFAFRWSPGARVADDRHVVELPNTLVEFIIEANGDESKVTIKESGFAKLPIESGASSHNDNSEGWTFMAERLSKLINVA